MSENIEQDGCIVTTGTFDGLHRGHVLVLDRLRAEAQARGLRPVAATFDRHPLAVIDPCRAPHILMTPPERDRRIREMGIELAEMRFDHRMRGLTAAQWMELLRDCYGARVLLLGYDNTFGCDGTGMHLADYQRLASRLGLEIIEAPVLPGVSSSAVRKALAAGQLDEANSMLGYPWTLTAPVVHGRSMGRSIGFRTANMSVDPRLQLPLPGVYATAVEMPDGSERPSVTNIGVRPTFGDDGGVSVETHIPGFEGDLYGRRLTIRPVRRIRDEQRFDNIGDLKRRIALDVDECLDAVPITV